MNVSNLYVARETMNPPSCMSRFFIPITVLFSEHSARVIVMTVPGSLLFSSVLEQVVIYLKLLTIRAARHGGCAVTLGIGG